MQLEEIGRNIWTYAGGTVRFNGLPFPTRTTIVRLNDGSLWIHSPGRLDDDLKAELEALGDVRHLIAPNKLHHLFLREWIDAYPNALKYAPPGLAEKRKDIEFDRALSDRPEECWKEEIDQTIFHGSPVMEEVVFSHKPSKTLILADLIENFDPRTLNWWQRIVARAAGILSPNGKMPIDWRMTFVLGGKREARKSLEKMLSWDTDRIVLSHGECVSENGKAFLERSYGWLIKTAKHAQA